MKDKFDLKNLKSACMCRSGAVSPVVYGPVFGLARSVNGSKLVVLGRAKNAKSERTGSDLTEPKRPRS